ncbi:hypothetical protein HMPREF1983_01205 [Gemella bergeri ATCC 700627]|uniref:Uncharacterized protein n=1 Tax=Gemella bergeri ATCC 700627 TaxID=1321820 RepID=U2Q2V4_9BACL|nr:hypothetical protein HMPREF1983_01205 [Gemella bergeri ATCC 700627]
MICSKNKAGDIMDKNVNFNNVLKIILVEWKLLELSKEKLFEKVEQFYEGGNKNETENKKS